MKLEKSDIITALEIAKTVLEHEALGDMVSRQLDLTEAEMDRLHSLLTTYLEGK
jgi:hypothetical protein